jgi:L-lysine 6-transaminase
MSKSTTSGSQNQVNRHSTRGVYTRHSINCPQDLILDLEHSSGSWIVDKSSGEKYLDLYTMYASQAVGYNHPQLCAAEAELGRAAMHKPSCSEVYMEKMAEFLTEFESVGIPDYLPNAFFIEGGALAVENALKTAFDWKVRKNRSKGCKTDGGKKIIHFREAFHGRSGYTLSLTNTESAHKTSLFPQFDWPRILNPKVTFPLNQENQARVKAAEEEALQEIEQVLDQEGSAIAGMILEPIQGEGGDNHFRSEFIRALRKVCDKNDILLIFDEIQSGVGLTGSFWAHEHFGVRPDIIAFGKKSQVCGILAGPRIDEVPENVFRSSGRIGSTWGGNLTDMVRFKHILKIIQAEDLMGNARRQGQLLLSGLQALTEQFPSLLSNPRGKGLMCAVDLPNSQSRELLIERMRKKGVILAGCGALGIRFRPHLDVTASDLQYGLDILRRVLESFNQ